VGAQRRCSQKSIRDYRPALLPGKTILGLRIGLLHTDTSLAGASREPVLAASEALLAESRVRGISLDADQGGVEQEAALGLAAAMNLDADVVATRRTPASDCHPSMNTSSGSSATNRGGISRYYRRRFEAVGHAWVGQVAPQELPNLAAALRPKCRFPGGAGQIRKYVEMVLGKQYPLIGGLRHRNGEWLGVVAGWYGPGQTMLLFQLQNDLGFQKDSLSVVLRGYLIKALIRKQIREIAFLNDVAGPLARYGDTRWVRTARIRLDKTHWTWRMARATVRKLGSRMPRELHWSLQSIAPFGCPRAGNRRGISDKMKIL